MGDLSPNLSRHEMACHCGCGFDTADIELVGVLQGTCDHFRHDMGYKVIIVVTGPNRCRKHNKEEGGADESQHIYARAADFQIFIIKHGVKEQIPPKVVYDYLDGKYPGKYGLGLYSNRCHSDTRTVGVWRSEG